jgi:hypothetical protein
LSIALTTTVSVRAWSFGSQIEVPTLPAVLNQHRLA